MHESPPENFEIHVDSSCVSDSTDLRKPSKRHDSNETTIHEVHDTHSDQEGSQLSQVSRDEHAEALIHATARAVVAGLEQDSCGQEDSILSARTDESYKGENELSYEEDTELTYGDESEQNYESDVDHEAQDQYDCSASSHHEDDVFSPDNGRSNRSSLNSITDEDVQVKTGMQEGNQNRVREHVEDPHSPQSHISRASSNAFSVIPEPLTTISPTPYTPSKVNPRPPFRTPSSIRAMQMSSPTPSVFGGSPRSSKRPAVSRVETPQPQIQPSSKSKTPTRFKAKKQLPLVLLHVTVLPLRWSYSAAIDAMTGDGLTRELHNIRESWKLLQEKLRDTVLERGILLPHPQDSYEVLEERLLEALELPVRPRARILSCGHYMGPDDFSSEEDSEDEGGEVRSSRREKWCDICGQEVKYDEFSIGGKQKRFRIKIYASNGLMTAGSWAAAWREMERVDVEMVPFMPSHLVQLMDSLAASPSRSQAVDRPIHTVEHAHESCPEEQQDPGEEGDASQRQKMEEERLREVYGDEAPEHPARPKGDRLPRRTRAVRQQQYGDSLAELILAALKVAMRDKRNVLIVMLSVLVLGLAIRGRPAPEILFHKEPILPTVERDANLVQEFSNLAKVPSIDPQAIRTGPDPGPQILPEVVRPAVVKPAVIEPEVAEPEVLEPEAAQAVVSELEVAKLVVVEPVGPVPDEVPVRIEEPKVKEQPSPSAPKEVVITPNDPCQECKRHLASQVTPVESDSTLYEPENEVGPETVEQAVASKDTAPQTVT